MYRYLGIRKDNFSRFCDVCGEYRRDLRELYVGNVSITMCPRCRKKLGLRLLKSVEKRTVSKYENKRIYD